MGFSLWNLLKACVLVINALALLHPHRFLKNYGLDKVNEGTGVKQQIAGMLHAARFMRWPLVAINSLIILVELLFG